MKHKKLFSIIYWIISLTWGALMTIPGLIVAGILILFGYKPHKNGCSFIIEIGGNWGGLELGAIALCGNYSKSSPGWFEHTRRHEFGHSIQQLLFGPFQVLLVGIPSAIRYWYQRIARTKGKYFGPGWYDSIWFEGTATKWGTYFVDKLEN